LSSISKVLATRPTAGTKRWSKIQSHLNGAGWRRQIGGSLVGPPSLKLPNRAMHWSSITVRKDAPDAASVPKLHSKCTALCLCSGDCYW
jgi:hypothetical protein